MSEGTTTTSIRQTLAARLLTLTPGLLTRESEEPYPTFRATTHSPVHGEFAVGILSVLPLETSGGRQRVADGQHATVAVRIAPAYQLTPTDRVVSYDAAQAAAKTVRDSLVERGWHPGFTLTWKGTVIDTGPDGWVYPEHSFDISANLSLS